MDTQVTVHQHLVSLLTLLVSLLTLHGLGVQEHTEEVAKNENLVVKRIIPEAMVGILCQPFLFYIWLLILLKVSLLIPKNEAKYLNGTR